jgi:hypothetical protein
MLTSIRAYDDEGREIARGDILFTGSTDGGSAFTFPRAGGLASGVILARDRARLDAGERVLVMLDSDFVRIEKA